ncbi:UbiA prenyltransferase family [Earliella scabrosa]|nr:UbiA prenyltransferase family [Earliella scabrosa]
MIYHNFFRPEVPVPPTLRISIRDVTYSLYTLYLFTCSDFKTVVIPVTLFGTLAAPVGADTHYIAPRLIWVWSNLLQVTVSNQSSSPDEDRVNKPWRPIPAGRISQEHARRLRWILAPTCLVLSIICYVPWEGAVIAMANIAYQDFHFDAHWFPRNVCNALAYAAFNAGASRVMVGEYPVLNTSQTSLKAQVLNALLILTTIQVQDFQDVDGDRATGRMTLPIAYPWASRLSISLILPAWSIFLSLFWNVGFLSSAVLVSLGAYVGAQLYSNRRTPTRDADMYRIYNVWLSFVHAIPFLYGD